MNLQILQQGKAFLLMSKIMDNVGKEMKMIQVLTLGRKLLNHFCVITQVIMCM